jgi:hypothetical protein
MAIRTGWNPVSDPEAGNAPTTKAESPVADGAKATEKARIGWLGLAIAAFFGLYYAYDVWAAVATIVALPGAYVEQGLQQSDVPWWLLVIGLLVPIVAYVAAFVISLRMNIAAKAVIFILGIAVTSALSLSIVALELVIRTRLLDTLILS